jgi:hypothetical protein
VILEVNDSSDYFVEKTELSMNKARISGKLRGDGEGGVLLISTGEIFATGTHKST